MELTFIITTLLPMGLVLILLVWVIGLHLRIAKLTHGSTGSLEKIINTILIDHENIHNDHTQLLKKYLALSDQSTVSLQGIGFVRFNPFQDTGSKQSFALALLDRAGNGVLISTLSTRERMNIFGKKISAFTVDQELSDEEQQALDQAKKSLI